MKTLGLIWIIGAVVAGIVLFPVVLIVIAIKSMSYDGKAIRMARALGGKLSTTLPKYQAASLSGSRRAP